VYPRRCFELVRLAIGSPVLYYQPKYSRYGGAYLAVAIVRSVHKVPGFPRLMMAEVDDYTKLNRPVMLWEKDGGHEGAFNLINRRSTAMIDVRAISRAESDAILEDSETDKSAPVVQDEAVSPPNRSLSEVNKKVEDLLPAEDAGISAPYTWRQHRVRLPLRLVSLARYSGTCIFTSIRQPLSANLFEVEACHLQPLWANGPDEINNVALMSATFHKLYDAGLIALDDDFTIRVKDVVDPRLQMLLNPSGVASLPEDKRFWPDVAYIRYHRQRIFGASS
jgi:hypothetical protein